MYRKDRLTSGEGRWPMIAYRTETGREKLSRVILNSIGILNFDINLGRAAFGEILMLKLGGNYFRAEF
jgi:hypothetical protein